MVTIHAPSPSDYPDHQNQLKYFDHPNHTTQNKGFYILQKKLTRTSISKNKLTQNDEPHSSCHEPQFAKLAKDREKKLAN